MFYWRNKARSAPIFVLLSLSVAVIGVVATLTGSILGSIYSVDVLPYEYFTLLISKDLIIEQSTMVSLDQNPTISHTVPFLDSSIRVSGLFGSEPRRVYALSNEDIAYVLDNLNLRLLAGQLPEPGTNQIVLHESIAKSRHLRIGSQVGQELDASDYLWGLFEVSGIMSGPIPIGVASLEFFKQQWMFDIGDNAFALMTFPRGDIAAMNQSLDATISDRLTIRDLEYASETYNEESREMDLLLWILNLAIIGIISLSTGMLNTIHFLNRMKEYGVMFMIGLDYVSLLRRTLAEVAILSFVGFAGGTALSWLLTWAISTQVFAPRGIPIQVYSMRYVSFTLPIPVFLALFSFLTIRWHIKKLDVIAIIEGRD